MSREYPHHHAGIHVRTECGTWTEVPLSAMLPRRDADGVARYADDVVFCPLHSTAEHVTKVRDREWLSWCENCRWYRWCGQSQTDALRYRNAHHRRYGAHFVHTDLAPLPGYEYYRLITPEPLWS